MVVWKRILLDERNHEFCWRCLECSLRYDSTEFSNKVRAGNVNLGIIGIKVALKDLQLSRKRSREMNNKILDQTKLSTSIKHKEKGKSGGKHTHTHISR